MRDKLQAYSDVCLNGVLSAIIEQYLAKETTLKQDIAFILCYRLPIKIEAVTGQQIRRHNAKLLTF